MWRLHQWPVDSPHTGRVMQCFNIWGQSFEMQWRLYDVRVYLNGNIVILTKLASLVAPEVDKILSIKMCYVYTIALKVDNNITRVDGIIGMLMDGITNRRLEHCINIIVTSDHGRLMTSWYESAFHITDPLCGDSTGNRWIPLTKVQLWRTAMLKLMLNRKRQFNK